MKQQFNEIIRSKDLKDITLDLVEKVLDDGITNEILQEIPILKSLVAAKDIYTSYTDRIFIKKAMNVLLEIGDINWTERVGLIAELEDRDESGAEKILMAIDRLETTEKCRLFGRLCRLKATGKLESSEDFLRLTKLIQDAYLKDLSLVTDFEIGRMVKIYEGEYYPLISLGLIYQEPAEQKPIRRNHWQRNEWDPEYKGGEVELKYALSDLGRKLLAHYYDLFPENKKQRL